MPGLVMLLTVPAALAEEAAAPCPEVDLDVAAEDAVGAVTDDELVYARDLADQALTQLGCVSRVADPEDLATLYQARAAAGFFADPPLAFEADLVQATVVHPGWFNDRFGPDLRRAWEEAGARVSGEATLSVWPIPDESLLYVDGHPWEAQPVVVLPGQHLVQVAKGAEVVWFWHGPLEAGGEVDLATGLPEPTRARLLRDNPLLVGGLAAGLAVGGAWYPVHSYGKRFGEGSEHYDVQADPVDALDSDWRRFRLMEVGLGAGTAVATAALTAHLIQRIRRREAT